MLFFGDYIYIGLLSYELKALSVCFMFFTGVIKLYLPSDCQFDKDNDDNDNRNNHDSDNNTNCNIIVI